MKKFKLIGSIPVKAYTTVLADTYEEAIAKAKQKPVIFDGDEDERIFWIGYLDRGEPYDISIKEEEKDGPIYEIPTDFVLPC